MRSGQFGRSAEVDSTSKLPPEVDSTLTSKPKLRKPLSSSLWHPWSLNVEHIYTSSHAGLPSKNVKLGGHPIFRAIGKSRHFVILALILSRLEKASALVSGCPPRFLIFSAQWSLELSTQPIIFLSVGAPCFFLDLGAVLLNKKINEFKTVFLMS